MKCPRSVTTLVLVAATACTSTHPQVVHLDPIEIKQRTTASGKKVYIKDFVLLHDEAMAHYRDKRYREAVELLEIVIDEFPRHKQLSAVHYHAGLSRLFLRDFDKSASHFRQAIRHYHGTRDARDALFLLAEALNRAGKFEEAANVYQGALADAEVQRLIGGELGVLDRLEAMARRGINLRAAGRPQAADRQFRQVDRMYRNNRDLRLVAESNWVARAYFERGEIYRTLFASIRFKLPVERMKRELEDKANLFLKAQNVYFRAVRLHNAKWSLAAGYQIGNLYAQLIDDIDNAEVPQGLDSFTLEAYREELWKHTGTLARKAVVVFRKNIALAKRMGRNNEWVRRSQEQLDRMETLIREQNELAQRAQPIEVAAPQEGKDPARAKPRKRR